MGWDDFSNWESARSFIWVNEHSIVVEVRLGFLGKEQTLAIWISAEL
jgi:hypothetical protein